MDRFLEMQAFTEVVDAGSFVGAAEKLGISKAAASRHVGSLESRLGVRLLHRTTRRLSLTEEGHVFLARCRDLLAGVAAAEAELDLRSVAVRGRLRVNAPLSYGIQYLAPLWPQFHARYPDVRLEITLSDRKVDLVEEGYDVAIRISTLSDSSLVARRLADTRMILCAAPDYLAAHGKPQSPADLHDHAVIAYSYWSGGDEWRFDGPDGPLQVRVSPWMHSNNGETCVRAAMAGHGLVLEPDFLVRRYLDAGDLVECMPDYRVQAPGIFAVYPTRRQVPPKVRALVDFLAEVLGGA